MKKKKKQKVLVSKTLNPEYKQVITTYMWAANIEVEWFETLPKNIADYSGTFYNPNHNESLLPCNRRYAHI